MMKLHNLIFSISMALLLALSVAVPKPAFAVANFHPSASDLAQLPPYCKAKALKNGNDRKIPDVKRWSRRLGGKDYNHIHHYCMGLQSLNQAKATFGDLPKKNAALRRAEDNIQYSQRNATKRFFLHPEMSLYLGKVYEAQNKPIQAQEQYHAAIKFKKSYSLAYAALHKLYLKLGDRKQAKEILQQGVENAPKSKKLKRLLKKMG